MFLKPECIPLDLRLEQGVMAGTHEGLAYAIDHMPLGDIARHVVVGRSVLAEAVTPSAEMLPMPTPALAQELGRPALRLVVDAEQIAA